MATMCNIKTLMEANSDESKVTKKEEDIGVAEEPEVIKCSKLGKKTVFQ